MRSALITTSFPWKADSFSSGQCVHLGDQIRLAFKADTRQRRQRDVSILDAHTVGESAIGLKQIRIRLVAAVAGDWLRRQGGFDRGDARADRLKIISFSTERRFYGR